MKDPSSQFVSLAHTTEPDGGHVPFAQWTDLLTLEPCPQTVKVELIVSTRTGYGFLSYGVEANDARVGRRDGQWFQNSGGRRWAWGLLRNSRW